MRPLDGVLLFDKPLGLSSNIALQKVRRLFQAEKAGHTGTLDPWRLVYYLFVLARLLSSPAHCWKQTKLIVH